MYFISWIGTEVRLATLEKQNCTTFLGSFIISGEIELYYISWIIYRLKHRLPVQKYNDYASWCTYHFGIEDIIKFSWFVWPSQNFIYYVSWKPYCRQPDRIRITVPTTLPFVFPCFQAFFVTKVENLKMYTQWRIDISTHNLRFRFK